MMDEVLAMVHEDLEHLIETTEGLLDELTLTRAAVEEVMHRTGQTA